LNFSIYMFLYKNKYLIHRFEDFFFTTTADTVVAEALSIAEGTALLGRKRITFDTKDKVIEVSMAYYNTDLHPYQINYFV
jgi:Transcriptional regulators